jgi:hypothetical protein
MHSSGKYVAAPLAIVLLLLAVYFSSKALAVRDAWMELAQKNEAAIKKNDEEIEKRTRTMLDRRAELARTMIGWDREWPSVQARLEQDGNLGLALGTNQGSQSIHADEVLYVFAPNPDGTSVYVGDFKIIKPGDTNSIAKPNSRRRRDDLKQAQFDKLRVRSMVPIQFQTRLAALDQQLLAAELDLASNQEEVIRQAKLNEQTDKLIASRMAEINGDKALEGQPIDEVYILGLLTAIVKEEEDRNAALIEADRLTHELKRTRDSFEQIRKENLLRVESLPAPPAQKRTVGAAR